jgi:chitodextrinase
MLTMKDSIRTLGNGETQAVAPGSASNPANVKRVEAILCSAKWDALFPRREPTYTYQRFLQAIAKFPALCATYTDGRNSDAICRRALATMFAHFAQETGGHNPGDSVPEWRQALVYLRESGCTETGPGCGYNMECSASSWITEAWPCGRNPDGSFKKYYGRGAKQLSYNYNYGPFSQFMFGDVRVLLDSPDQVASTWLNLASASFFYVYPQPPKASMLHVVDGTWTPNSVDAANGLTNSFATTIMIINGGIECGHGYDKPQAVNRAAYYQEFAREMGVSIVGEQLSCKDQRPFSAGGAGALSIYWEKDWHTGAEYRCMLVNYQTAYSALISGDYQKCVEKGWGITLR